jgi:hypothetical protein
MTDREILKAMFDRVDLDYYENKETSAIEIDAGDPGLYVSIEFDEDGVLVGPRALE